MNESPSASESSPLLFSPRDSSPVASVRHAEDDPLTTLMSQPRSVELARSPRREPGNGEHAWEVLERYGQHLVSVATPQEQVQLTLSAVQECLAADSLFWLAEETEAGGAEGPVSLSPGWQRDFLTWLVRRSPSQPRQVLCSFLDPAAKPMNPWPCSVVLVQMVPGQASWLAALSFHPRRLFTPVDLQLLRLVRRIWLNQRPKDPEDEKLKEIISGLICCLSSTLEAKDPHMRGHSERVARIARRLGEQMGLPAAFVRDLYLAGLVHDIGKVGIHEGVLQKRTPLTDAEREHLRQHPGIGDRILAPIKPLQSLRPAVRGHHERYDGTGYPDGLCGEAIPLAARILAVADAVDAMLAERPYRPALPAEKVRQILSAGAGKQWDPLVIEHLLACQTELFALAQ